MKKLMVLTTFLLSLSINAKSLICVCERTKCSDIRISFTEKKPATYLKVNFLNGAESIEGFATIRERRDKSFYSIENFVIVKKNESYSLFQRSQYTCSEE